MKRSIVFAAALIAALTAVPAGAHEQRAVGALRVVVGWQNEPAVAGSINAVHVRVSRDTSPVMAARLQARVTFADTSSEQLPLEPAFGSPGEYLAPIVPTRPGTYTFHVTGTIGSTRFDQRFTSGERTFDDVRPVGELEFPEEDPTRAELADRARRTDQQVATAVRRADDVASRSTLALLVGAAGLVLGVAALLAALARRKGSAA